MLPRALLLPVLAGLAMVGCASPSEWHREGSDQAQLQRDLAECNHEAQIATAGGRDPFWAAAQMGELSKSCMKLRGYGLRERTPG